MSFIKITKSISSSVGRAAFMVSLLLVSQRSQALGSPAAGDTRLFSIQMKAKVLIISKDFWWALDGRFSDSSNDAPIERFRFHGKGPIGSPDDLSFTPEQLRQGVELTSTTEGGQRRIISAVYAPDFDVQRGGVIYVAFASRFSGSPAYDITEVRAERDGRGFRFAHDAGNGGMRTLSSVQLNVRVNILDFASTRLDQVGYYNHGQAAGVARLVHMEQSQDPAHVRFLARLRQLERRR